MVVMMRDGGGSVPQQPTVPPPPPTPANLGRADAQAANASVAAMTPQQQAQLTGDVQALPVAERNELINQLATVLEPAQLRQLEPVFGSDVVREAVETRAGVVVREEYAALTGSGAPSSRPAQRSGLDDGEQASRAQEDYADNVANSGILATLQLSDLMLEHAGDPAYLSELVRLAKDDGTLGAVVDAPYGGLYQKEGDTYTWDTPGNDGDARREVFATAIATAIDCGAISETDLRALAVDSGGWQDVAGRIDVAQVGATDTTRATATSLDDLLGAQDGAQEDADRLDEDLGGLLAQAGPMTPEQQAAFIEAFRNDPEHKPTYDTLIESSQALSDYMSTHRNEVLDAAVRDPAVAGQVNEAIATLARNGHGVEAMTLLAQIQRVPDSALAGAFAGFDLSGEVLTDAASSAMSELLAANDGSVSQAQAQFTTLMSAFGQGVPAWGGYKDFSDGQKLLNDLAGGNYSALDRYKLQWDSSSPLFRAFAAAGVVAGAVSAANAGNSEEYLLAIGGLAQSGENGARLLAGAMDALADSGRLAQYSGTFAGTAGFAARLAPALGLIASSASLVNSIQEASDGNVGYAIAAFGDVLGVLGSALEFTPVAPAGFIVSGIGAIISGVGSFVGELINGNERREQIEGYLVEAGVDPQIADEMASRGSDLFDMAETLDMSAEDIQALLVAHPEVALSAGHVGIITRAAEACGLQGSEVLGFVDKLAGDNADFAWDLFGIVSALPTSDTQAQAFLRSYIENNYDSAIEYAQAQSPELFGAAAEEREAAVRDYESDGFTPSYALALGNRLIDNTDPAYRAEMIGRLAADGRLEMFAEELGPYGGDWAEASRAGISDAVAAGTITQEQADAALGHF
jgi:hypothetical protein